MAEQARGLPIPQPPSQPFQNRAAVTSTAQGSPWPQLARGLGHTRNSPGVLGSPNAPRGWSRTSPELTSNDIP